LDNTTLLKKLKNHGATGSLSLKSGPSINVDVADNISPAFDIKQDSASYISIITTNGSESITIGNVTNNPDITFLGSGSISGLPSSAQITVADTEGTSTYVVLAGAATGAQAPLTDEALTYNALTNALSTTTFIGALSGNATTVTTNANLSGDVTSVGNTTTIAAKAVDIAMLADGTDGELITWSATGVAATVAVGTATHVLTSNGAGAAPTFQAPAGGGLVFITESENTTTQNTIDLSVDSVNYGLVLKPNGTGALMWTTPDGTTTGGDARGTNAIDLQITRVTNSARVASGLQSCIIGGNDHIASGAQSACIGGISNDATNIATFCGGGQNNLANGVNSVILGGQGGTSTADGAGVVGGNGNVTATGGDNCGILGGTSNDVSGTGDEGICLGGAFSLVSKQAGVTTGYMAAADHPTTFVFSGNTETASDGQRGFSQGQLVHYDEQSTTNAVVQLSSLGTEFTVPANSAITKVGVISAWDTTGSASGHWSYVVAARNDAGTVTIVGQTMDLIGEDIDGGGAVGFPEWVVSGALCRLQVSTGTTNTLRWSAAELLSRAVGA
jgi:hypothetical protein